MTDRRDLEASLAEMDRKLRELQRELELVSAPSQEPAEPEPAPQPAPAPEPEPAPDPIESVVEEAAARVGELGRRIDDLARLRDDLDGATQALRTEYRSRPAPAASADEVVVEAGPFADISSVSAFEQALGQVPGVEEALVRSFEGNRAIIDVRLRVS
ncbi:MAG: hypothetical protein QOJ97_1780 [Solirubrobacteraceae bacterium]|jgi:hypothetical protein|nr:hypothetical protein [Solirubrobacteraceae bacterium]